MKIQLYQIFFYGTILGSNSGARRYHRRISGTVRFFTLYLHTLWQVSSGGSSIIDQCSASKTLQAAVAYKSPRITYNNSVEASR